MRNPDSNRQPWEINRRTALHVAIMIGKACLVTGCQQVLGGNEQQTPLTTIIRPEQEKTTVAIWDSKNLNNIGEVYRYNIETFAELIRKNGGITVLAGKKVELLKELKLETHEEWVGKFKSGTSASGVSLLGVDTCLNATMILAAWRKAEVSIGEDLSAEFTRHFWSNNSVPTHYGIGEQIVGTNYTVEGVSLYANTNKAEKQDLTLINGSNTNLRIDQELIKIETVLVLRTTVNKV